MEIPSAVTQWAFAGKPGNIKSQNRYSTANAGNGYNMRCKVNGQYLTYVETTFGISLGFIKSSNEHKIHFRLPDGKEREILTGEKVAFGIGGGDAFLRYAHRTVNINLTWSSEPSYEWRIYAPSAEKGKSIPTGSRVAMINENVEPQADFLVYLDRPVGADVGWTTSPDWKHKVAEWITKRAFTTLVGALI